MQVGFFVVFFFPPINTFQNVDYLCSNHGSFTVKLCDHEHGFQPNHAVPQFHDNKTGHNNST